MIYIITFIRYKWLDYQFCLRVPWVLFLLFFPNNAQTLAQSHFFAKWYANPPKNHIHRLIRYTSLYLFSHFIMQWEEDHLDQSEKTGRCQILTFKDLVACCTHLDHWHLQPIKLLRICFSLYHSWHSQVMCYSVDDFHWDRNEQTNKVKFLDESYFIFPCLKKPKAGLLECIHSGIVKINANICWKRLGFELSTPLSGIMESMWQVGSHGD